EDEGGHRRARSLVPKKTASEEILDAVESWHGHRGRAGFRLFARPRWPCHGHTGLRLERAAAAAGFGGVGVGEHEAAAVEPFVEIDRGAVEVQGALLIDDQLYAVVLVGGIGFLVGLLLEI